MIVDLARVRYVGYWKLSEMLTTGETKTISSSFASKATLKGPDLQWNQSTTQDPNLLREPGFIRQDINRLITRLAGEVTKVDSATPVFSPGRLYEVSGLAKFAVLHHDDFRIDDGLPKPRVAFWLIETSFAGRSGATWILLHGTADENLSENYMGKMPSSRAGSGTETFFELLFSDAHAAHLQSSARRLTNYDKIYATYSMMWDVEHSEEIESIFRCFQAVDIPSSSPVYAFAATDEGGGAAIVVELIVGSPLLVQSPSIMPDPSSWQRFRRWLRLKFRASFAGSAG